MPPSGPRTGAATLPVVLGLALAFTVVDPLVLSLNLPQVSRTLHVPPQVVGLLGGAATLVMAASVLAAGRLGDAVGLKRLLMLGLVVVTVVDLLSMLSPGYGFLLAMRFLDGLGMTALLGVPLALLKVSVAPERRPVAIGVLMAVDVVLCGVIPAFTGWAVEVVGWRFLFLIAPLLCLVSLWLTARYVPESPVQRGGRRLADAKTRGLSVPRAARAVDAVRSGMAQSPGSTVYDPNLLRQASGLNLGLDFTGGLRLTMLVVSVLPLVVAAAALVLMPRRVPPEQEVHRSRTGREPNEPT
ncbi:MFS transporter [Streptomyces sp. NTH33]|uniref:MFS transporter n=1 Tax=Streptomyces sp. NTH33 TaxID=1735453 RepID=UPI001C64DE9F|nr:MFS transporter [Streptomyces sp. NTH33]